jgi:hypothetical protein
MSKLQTMENIVLQVLENSPLARKDDYVLMWLVTDIFNPDLQNQRFGDVLYNHKENGLPNWETVTRCRRKLQEKYPYLKDATTSVMRDKEQQEYIDYARS